MCGGRKKVAKCYRWNKSRWAADFIRTDVVGPIYQVERFRRRFGIPQTLYKGVKKELLQHIPEYISTRMIAGSRPGKPMDVKIMIALKMLCSGNSADRKDYVADMAEETGRQYVHRFCEDVVKIYGETYMKVWSTEEEVSDMENINERNVFPGSVGAIDWSKPLWKNCLTQDKGKYLIKKDSRLVAIQFKAWFHADVYWSN